MPYYDNFVQVNHNSKSMVMRKYLFLLAFLLPLLTSCDDDKSAYMKTVTGKAGEVIVVLAR